MSSPNYNTLPRSSDCENGGGEADNLLGRSQRKVQHLWDGFIDFAFQGNILQIAFGLILAANFTDLIKSFVSDILMPPLSMILPVHKNMEEKFAVLKNGPHYNRTTGYNTLRQAQDDGALVMAYGRVQVIQWGQHPLTSTSYFINQIISFIMIGISLYGLALIYTAVSNDPIIKHTKKCKYCRKSISKKASQLGGHWWTMLMGEQAARCINCTSWLDGREDRVST